MSNHSPQGSIEAQRLLENMAGEVLRTKPEGHKKDLGTSLVAKDQFIRLIAGGKSIKECALILGREMSTLRKWFKEPQVMEKIKDINSDMYEEIDKDLTFRAKATHEKLYQAADEALDTVIDLMRGADNEVIKLRASQDLLDRRPDTSKVHRVDKRSVNVNIDMKWLEQAAVVEAEEGRTING